MTRSVLVLALLLLAPLASSSSPAPFEDRGETCVMFVDTAHCRVALEGTVAFDCHEAGCLLVLAGSAWGESDAPSYHSLSAFVIEYGSYGWRAPLCGASGVEPALACDFATEVQVPLELGECSRVVVGAAWREMVTTFVAGANKWLDLCRTHTGAGTLAFVDGPQ